MLRLKNAGLDDDNFSMGLLSQLFRVELVDLSENGFSNLEVRLISFECLSKNS